MAKNSAKEQNAMSAASVFKAIDNVLKKPGCGCSGSLDYMEQSSWLLFLRYLDAREEERKLEARLNGKVYEPALAKRLRWSEWAYPLDAEGKLDYEKMLKGDELLNFVRQQLFPGLKRLRDENPDTNSLQYRIGSIFTEMTCKFTSGYSIREVRAFCPVRVASGRNGECRTRRRPVLHAAVADPGDGARPRSAARREGL